MALPANVDLAGEMGVGIALSLNSLCLFVQDAGTPSSMIWTDGWIFLSQMQFFPLPTKIFNRQLFLVSQR